MREGRQIVSAGPLSRRRSGSALLQLLGDEKGQLEALHVVEPGIAEGLVPRGQTRLVDLLRPAQALGDVIAGELHVDAARERAHGAMRLEEPAHLVHHVIEATGFVSGGRGDAVPMHRIGHPERKSAGVAHRLQQRWQSVANLPRSHTRDEGEPTGLAFRIELVDQSERRLRRGGRAELDADRVADLREVVHVRAVQLTSALPDPEEVRRGVVGSPGPRVDPGHRTLVVHQEALVPGEELHTAQLLEVRAGRLHELDRTVDLSRHPLIALVGRVLCEALVPRVHLAEIGEASLGERA
ncbi:hypothetical protein ABE10_02390, partial [Bacillus toyonensis]|nr:hypothetical protein [Bacillus toyonensis]